MAAGFEAAVLELTIECRSAVHADKVIRALRDNSFEVRVVADTPLGSDYDGADKPAR